MTLTSTLQIANKSMLFNQSALNTISHNVANTNTEGFSRQEVQGQANIVGGRGDGVSLAEVQRKIDRLLVQRLTQQRSESGAAQARADFMKNLEVLFGVPGSDASIEKVLDKMFTELNNVANFPDSTSQRLNFVQNAQFAVDAIGDIDTQLREIQFQIDNQLNNEINTINNALERISTLNENIAQLEATAINAQNTNDLRDKRQQQINIVAERLKVNITEDDFGRARLVTENGRRLVDTSFVKLERIPPATPGGFAGIGLRSVKSDGSLSATVFPLQANNLTAGSIQGMVDVRDNVIPDVESQIDNFASRLIEEMNTVHSRGVGVPPPNSLTSAELQTPGVDLISEIGLVGGGTFDISIVDQTTGAPINTATVTLSGAPLSTGQLVTDINTALGGAGFPPSVSASFTGNRLTVEDTSNTFGIVMGNDSDDFLGKIKMNPFLEGTDAETLAIRSDILTDSNLVAAAKMRSDGGVSFDNNANAIDMAQLGETDFSFTAAGSLSAQNDTLEGYFTTISSNYAVRLQDSETRLSFADSITNDMITRSESVSGVNMDEELANMILFQNSFQASARLVRLVDELLETVVNII